MRRISLLALAALLVFTTGCSRGASEKGADASPSRSTAALQIGAWAGPLHTSAAKVGQQILVARAKGKPTPKNLNGFRGLLLNNQSFQQYSTDGTEFSFCVRSPSGWVAYDSTYGGTVAAGATDSCSTDPVEQIVAVHQAAADLGAELEAAIAKQDGDPYANEREVFDKAELPAGIELGATDIGYRVAQFCVQDDTGVWAAYKSKAPATEHITVGILGGC